MEAFNYVCTHLERVDELLAMLVVLFIVLVVELGFLIRSSRRHAEAASQLLDLKKKNKQHKSSNLATDHLPSVFVPLPHLNEAADRKNPVKYKVGNDTTGSQDADESKNRTHTKKYR